MIYRHLDKELLKSFQQYPVVALTGPRQSGKSTLVRSLFEQVPYVNLEGLSERDFAKSDPRGFIASYPNGAIIDEVQRAPELLSEIQVQVDSKQQNGQFILTGSENLILSQHINQSLAGRVALHTLYPFSLAELDNELTNTIDNVLFRGFYPRTVVQSLPPREATSNYIATYIERDIRQIGNIGDLSTFQRFLTLCASRVGQLLNKVSLAADVGVSATTAERWLSILESTYICKRIYPWFTNTRKRIVKMPKLYFIDPAIICTLLGIRSSEDLNTHPLKGAIFENLQVIEVLKTIANRGASLPVYFFRDHAGYEVDIVLEYSNGILPIEIKLAQTFSPDALRGIEALKHFGKKIHSPNIVVLGGQIEQRRTDVTILPWNMLGTELVQQHVVF